MMRKNIVPYVCLLLVAFPLDACFADGPKCSGSDTLTTLQQLLDQHAGDIYNNIDQTRLGRMIGALGVQTIPFI